MWGPQQQPERKQVKKTLMVQWLTGLGLEAAAVRKAMADAGQAMWRADPVATLRALDAIPNHVLSLAGKVDGAALVDLRQELGGLSTWGGKEKALTAKARELLARHVLGGECLDARFLQDDYLLTDLLRRRGPEGAERRPREDGPEAPRGRIGGPEVTDRRPRDDAPEAPRWRIRRVP